MNYVRNVIAYIVTFNAVPKLTYFVVIVIVS